MLVAGGLGVGGDVYGVYRLSSGVLLSANSEYVRGFGTAAINQSGGVNSISSSLNVGVGVSGYSYGTYCLTGTGLLSTYAEYVGNNGSGAFFQSGGTNLILGNGSLYIAAENSNSQGEYSLGGSGFLSAYGEFIGAVGLTSSAVFNQSAGTNTVTNELQLGSGTYFLSGSAPLSAYGEYVGAIGETASAAFSQSGGTNTVTNQFELDGGIYCLTGGALIVPNVSGSGGVFNFGGGTLVANSSFSTSQAITLTGVGGNGTVDNGGNALTLTGSLSGPGGLVLLGSGVLTLTGTQNTYSGSTIVEDGTLVVTSPRAITDGSSLAVGDGALSLFSPAATESIQSNVVAVPEPRPLSLLGVAGIIALAASTRFRKSPRLPRREVESFPRDRRLGLQPPLRWRKRDGLADRGMTLIELLVVLTIIMILAAATIPRLQPGIDRSRVREAARAVQIYFNSARNLALTTGRSCGVQIERLVASNGSAIESGCSMTISQLESPVAYCGEAIPSLATVTVGSLSRTTSATVNISYSPGINTALVKLGDRIQLGMQGPLYTIIGAGGATASLDVSQGLSVPWVAGSPPVPFRIFRQSVKSQAAALQLPAPAVIDLTFSGPDTVSPTQTPVFWNGAGISTQPVQIMFAPDGTIAWVNVYGVVSYPVTTICLLIGKRQNVNDKSSANWNSQDYNNIWLAINPRTGLVLTTDMAATGDNSPASVYASRAYARQSDSMGGK